MRTYKWMAVTSACAVVAGLSLADAASGVVQDGSRVLAAATEDRVEVFTGEASQAIAAGNRETYGLAYGLARQNPADFAPPYLDGQRVVLAAVTGSGHRLLDNQGWANAVTRSRQAPLSLAALDAIKHEVIGLSIGELPGSKGMHTSLVQAHRSRVVIESSSAPDELRVALAKRYGVARIAIRLTPDYVGGSLPAVDGRQNDNSNFEGGSRIQGVGPCTSGFQWYAASYGNMMLTAGHCTTAGGGDVYSPNGTKIGDTRYDYWWNDHGSTMPSGDTQYRGDISLVEVVSSQSTANSIHIGDASSTASRRVVGIYSRYQQWGDQMCIGGATSGERCAWFVDGVHLDHRYDSGTLLRNAFRVHRDSGCIQDGDSGAPMFIYNGDNLIVATGILSGGRRSPPCDEWGTDILDAYYSMPGSVKT